MQKDKQLTPKLVTAIISAGIMAFAGVVAETAMNITFPTLMREFGIGTAAVQWLTTGYLLMLAIIVPASGQSHHGDCRRYNNKSCHFNTSFWLIIIKFAVAIKLIMASDYLAYVYLVFLCFIFKFAQPLIMLFHSPVAVLT